FGTPSEEFADEAIPGLTVFEYVAWAPMLLPILVLGIYPNLIFSVTDDAVIKQLSAIAGG
ncbi:MAG: hypothetical protein OEY70_16020, partial [Acidimicrobiia bacterium]|nr:hypothetical protein [Acidimicrobiia bacterium]